MKKEELSKTDQNCYKQEKCPSVHIVKNKKYIFREHKNIWKDNHFTRYIIPEFDPFHLNRNQEQSWYYSSKDRHHQLHLNGTDDVSKEIHLYLSLSSLSSSSYYHIIITIIILITINISLYVMTQVHLISLIIY